MEEYGKKNYQLQNYKVRNIYDVIEDIPGKLISIQMDPDDPPVFIHSLLPPPNLNYVFSKVLGAKTEYKILGSGIGLTENESIISTLGEYIERYVAFVSQFECQEDMLIATERELKKKGIPHVSSKKFILFHEGQYSRNNFMYKKFTEDSYVKWIKGYSLIKEKEVYIPAAFVFIPYFIEKDEDPICPSSSSGLSSHTNYAKAITKGIYEVIERDAIMINWYGGMKLRSVETDIKEINDLCNYLLPKLCQLRFISGIALTDVSIPTYVTGIVSDSINDKISLAVGMSSNLNPLSGLAKSIIESIHTRIWAKVELSKKEMPLNRELRDFPDHVRLFNNKCMLPHFLKFIDEKSHVSLSNLYEEYKKFVNKNEKSHLKYLLKSIKKNNLDVIIVDITPEYIKKELDINVIRVVIPGLQLLMAGKYQYFGGTRLFTLPHRFGYRKEVLSFEDIKEIPHPFP